LWYSDEISLEMPDYTPPFIFAPPAENPSDAAVLDWISEMKPPQPPPAQDEQNKLKHTLAAAADHKLQPLKRRRLTREFSSVGRA
jgi:hypothetical protein